MGLFKNLFILFCFVFFIACTGNDNVKTNIDELYAAIPADTLTELVSISGFPDSTLTASQLATKKKLTKLLEEHLTVEDNQFVLLAEPEDFENAGLSKYYYIIYKKNFNDTSRAIDSLGIQNLDEKFKNGSIEKGYTIFSNEEKNKNKRSMDVFTVSLIVLLVLSIVLWVWAVYDLRKSRIATNSKLVWLVVLLFLPMIGPVVYFQMIKKQNTHKTISRKQ